MPAPFSDPAPEQGINREWHCPRSRNIHKAAVIGKLTVPEQPSEQPESVLRQHGIYEAFLPLKRLNRAAAWLIVIVESRIDNFRIELCHRSQPGARAPVPLVLRFAQHELST